MAELDRLLPVTAHRLQPGDTIRCRDDGQVHINAKDATQSRTLATVDVRRGENSPGRVLLTDTEGRDWQVWYHDVTWFVVPVASSVPADSGPK